MTTQQPPPIRTNPRQLPGGRPAHGPRPPMPLPRFAPAPTRRHRSVLAVLAKVVLWTVVGIAAFWVVCTLIVLTGGFAVVVPVTVYLTVRETRRRKRLRRGPRTARR